jgi:hypothetical protein
MRRTIGTASRLAQALPGQEVRSLGFIPNRPNVCGG